MADPITIGVAGGAALLLADALGKKTQGASQQQSPSAIAKEAQAALRAGDPVVTALQNTFQNKTGLAIVIRGVQAGVGIALGATLAIFTGAGGPIGVVIGVAIAIIAITIGGFIELFDLIHDLADNSQWRAVDQYERDWEACKQNGIQRIKLWAGTSGGTVSDAEADQAASAFADGYMQRLTLQRQWTATFTPQQAAISGISGYKGATIGWGDWTNAWRASNTGRVYGVPIGANWDYWKTRAYDARYGGGEDWNLWTSPPRKSPAGKFDNWYNAGRLMANVSGFVMAMQQPISAGASATSHAAYWRERGMFQGALRQDVGGGYPLPILEFENQLWSYTGIAGTGGFAPNFIGNI